MSNIIEEANIKRIAVSQLIPKGQMDEFFHSVTGDIADPNYKLVGAPTTIRSAEDWQDAILKYTKTTPFPRVRSLIGDDTAETARALGYTPGTEKAEEVLAALARIAEPTTIYKVQSLTTNDLADIKDFDAAAWLKEELVTGLNLELARAILIGDGRSGADPNKIPATKVIPIALDVAPYNTTVTLASNDPAALPGAILEARNNYASDNQPFGIISPTVLASILLTKDTDGNYIYENKEDLATYLDVQELIEAPVLDEPLSVGGPTALFILADLSAYELGNAYKDKVNSYEGFDIDFNKHKYLKEIRVSGALTQPLAAVTLTYQGA